jgi:hypothetical protein
MFREHGRERALNNVAEFWVPVRYLPRSRLEIRPLVRRTQSRVIGLAFINRCTWRNWEIGRMNHESVRPVKHGRQTQ